MMTYEKCLDIHGDKYFKDDINKASPVLLKLVCSFVDDKDDLLWIKECCTDNNKKIVDAYLGKN